MTRGGDERPTSVEELWPTGAVARRTGITEHTLRAWERRFGFPQPLRLPSGHRRYTSDQVRQLLLINRALRCGYRAGDVVPLDPGDVEQLIRECGQQPADADGAADVKKWVDEILLGAIAFDESTVQSLLRSDAAALGVSSFLRHRVVPLIEGIGTAWERGTLGIRHEHFVTGMLEEFLRELRRPLEVPSVGRPVVLAGLPDELHGLGLELVAAEVGVAGRRSVVLGPRTPIDEIVATAETLDAAAVGLTVSLFAPADAAMEGIESLRSALPPKTVLWLGGGGAATLESLPPGVELLSDLDAVAEALGRL